MKVSMHFSSHPGSRPALVKHHLTQACSVHRHSTITQPVVRPKAEHLRFLVARGNTSIRCNSSATDASSAGESAKPSWLAQRAQAFKTLITPFSNKEVNNRLLALCIAQALCSVATLIHDTYLPIYLQDVLGLSNTKVSFSRERLPPRTLSNVHCCLAGRKLYLVLTTTGSEPISAATLDHCCDPAVALL